MSDDFDASLEPTTPVWAVFGDLMAGLLGAFVLILVSALAMQLDLASQLESEVKQRQAETQRRQTSIQPPWAEGVGFEPTDGCPSHAFQACRFGRSRTPPGLTFTWWDLPSCGAARVAAG